MRCLYLCALVLFFALASFTNSTLHAAGFAHTKNFIVFAPAVPDHATGQALAEETLTLAENYRKQIAEEWFGEEVAQGEGRATINVSFDPGRERALTWAKDDPRRTLHAVYLRTTQDRGAVAIHEMLPHEIAHVVLASRFPDRLPPWLEEGIASRYDDADRINIRRRAIHEWTQSGDWPPLDTLIKSERIHAHSVEKYAASASLVDYLVERDGTKTLFEFAQDGKRLGWNRALRQHYQLDSVEHLQTEWTTWAGAKEQVAWREPRSVVNQ